jgi:ribonucleoside-diphosphate reductase beta chain
MKLNHTLLPMLDYHKAKRLIWDPRDIECDHDKTDWAAFTDRERDLILRAGSLFHAGEEAVTHDLAPLLMAIRRDGTHLEDEMFLTTQIFEEAKHFEFFDRWFDQVVRRSINPIDYLGPDYDTIFFHALPDSLNRLLTDTSAIAQVEASVVYHMIIEGVLAETGYHGFYKALKEKDLLRGLTTGVELVQRDEARHIAFGVYFLQRHVRADRSLWATIENKMNELLPAVMSIIGDALAPYGDDIPFGLDIEEMLGYAGDQFARRMNAIERALGESETTHE